jgi:SOS-response transcriptional repressor LexA
MEQQQQIRPTKKQRELLTFIQEFITSHGYGPSYREIMAGCNYTSVATVALHVSNLISRGHLRKNGRSARSLEVVDTPPEVLDKIPTNEIKPAEEKWLIEKIDYRFAQAEAAPAPDKVEIDNLYVLVGSLKVLGLEGAASSFAARLSELKKKQ